SASRREKAGRVPFAAPTVAAIHTRLGFVLALRIPFILNSLRTPVFGRLQPSYFQYLAHSFKKIGGWHNPSPSQNETQPFRSRREAKSGSEAAEGGIGEGDR